MASSLYGSELLVEGNEKCILGIDEAGRGPVLGPMVYACSYCPESQTELLKKQGFNDSKQLTESHREIFFDRIKDLDGSDLRMGYIINVISARTISEELQRKKKHNLNSISHEAAMSLIQEALNKGANIYKVFVDTVGDPEKYQEKLQKQFPQIHEITVSKKADALFPIVSAASICAKVTRDALIRDWVFEEEGVTFDRKFGSGYPGDASTKAWLMTNMDPVFGFPRFVRFSWQTTKTLLDKHCVSIDWGDEDDDDEKEAGAKPKKRQATINSFFTAPTVKPTDGPAVKRGKFFQTRNFSLSAPGQWQSQAD